MDFSPFIGRVLAHILYYLTEQDHIQSKNKKWYRVKRQNFLYTKKKVYNFEVEDWHTYFVGKLAWLVHNAKPCVGSGIKKLVNTLKRVSNRLKYLGRTPGKNSRTGREVFERMEKEGTARIHKGEKQFWDKHSNKWMDIKYADMSHIEDAVSWWNRVGRKFGAKSKEVREWMLNSKNYELEYYKINRSRGGKLNETYKPPLK